MTTTTQIIFVVAMILSIFIPFGTFLKGKQTKKRLKSSLAFNIFFFFGTLLTAAFISFSNGAVVFAADASVATEATLATGLGYLAAALVTGLACIGGGIAVASAASAALGAISEDSSMFGKSLIFVGLAEGFALYGLIISFMILGRL